MASRGPSDYLLAELSGKALNPGTSTERTGSSVIPLPNGSFPADTPPSNPNMFFGGSPTFSEKWPGTAPASKSPAPAQSFGPTTDWSNPETVSAYFASRGVTPAGTSPSYWANLWTGGGKNDPNYFFQRLQNADEFGGAGSGGTGGGEFDDKWGSTLESLVSKFLGKSDDAAANAKKNAADLADILNKRAADLQQPAFSTGDEAVLRARSSDALEQRRQQTLKNNREQIYLRGFEPTSGIATASDIATNRDFDSARTAIDSNLLQSEMTESQRRKDQATELQALAEQALNGGDTSAIQYYAGQLVGAQDPLNLEHSREADALAASNPGGASSALSSILSLISSGNGAAANQGNTNAANASNLVALLRIFGLA
jgi:hypothetical protein